MLAAGGLLVVGQGLLRHHAAHRASQEVERALGLTPGERVAARLGAAAPAAVVAARARGGDRDGGGHVAAAGQPGPVRAGAGVPAPWEVAVGGALVTALAFLALVAVAAATAGRRARGPARPARPRGSAWTALGPATLVGLRVAVRGHGRAVAVSAGAAVAVAGIVAALAFGSGIALLLSDPVRTGQAADLALEDAEEVDVAKLVGDPRVAALSVTRSVVARLADGGVLLVQAETQRKGEVPAGLVSGRMPRRADRDRAQPADRRAARRERRRHHHGGQPQRQAAPADRDRHRRRRGRRGHLGTTNVVTDAALGGLARTSPIVRAEIVAAPGQAGPLAAQLGRNLEILPRGDPARGAQPRRPRAAAGDPRRGARRRRGGGDGAHPHHRRAPPHPRDGRAGRDRRHAPAGPRHAGRARRRDRRPGAGARRARRAGHRPVAVVAGGDVHRGRAATSRPRSAC